MRLRAINVFSDYLGDEKQTKERTGELRKDSDFLHYIFCEKIKYIDNEYIKQLNIRCSPFIKEICIHEDYLDGYPVITIPFDYSMYCVLDEKEKKSYWINEVAKIFIFLKSRMNCENEKIDLYIEWLHKKE